MAKLRSYPDGRDVFEFQWSLLPDELLFDSRGFDRGSVCVVHDDLLKLRGEQLWTDCAHSQFMLALEMPDSGHWSRARCAHCGYSRLSEASVRFVTGKQKADFGNRKQFSPGWAASFGEDSRSRKAVAQMIH